MNDRRLEILKMVESGKISVDDGAKLLRAIEPARGRRHPCTGAVICISKDTGILDEVGKIVTGCCGEEAMKVARCCDTDKSVDVDCCCEPKDKE